MRKSKNKVYSWIAAMLTIALLTGQCQIYVLASEQTVPAVTETVGEDQAGTQADGDDGAGGDILKGDGESGGQDGTDHGAVDESGSGEGDHDGEDMGSNHNSAGDADNDGGDDVQEGSTGAGENGADGGEEGTGAGENGADDVQEGDNGTNSGDTGEVWQDECVCETNCIEGTVNVDCPVCAVDYSLCAIKAGGGVKPPEQEMSEETVSGNGDEFSQEAEAVVLMQEAEAYAVGDEFTDVSGFKCRVIGDGEVEVIGHQRRGGEPTIPETVSYNGSTYRVTAIGERGFSGYSITGIKIPEGVTRIGADAFHFCDKLVTIEMPDSITYIGTQAFVSCTKLQHVKIPKGVTTIENATFYGCESLESVIFQDGLTRIAEIAFENCYNLKEIVLPDSVESIGVRAFAWCSTMNSVKIPASLVSIEERAFYNCMVLNTMQIVVPSTENVTPPTVGGDAFITSPVLPAERSIVFLAEDGTPLTGDALEKAKTAYLDDSRDGNATDELWWGWKIERPPVEELYRVTIIVKKDDREWPDHGFTFALLPDAGGGFVPDMTKVPNGVYSIYDITGVPEDSLYSKARDTGMDVRVDGRDTDVNVEVDGADKETVINYYTATFYDGNQDYGDDTAQAPQIVLSGRQVSKPEDPIKENYEFAGWKTTDGGSTPYDFDSAVTTVTSIFASWEEKAAEQLHILATATEGGVISPIGDVVVTKGSEQVFTITPEEGYRIKAVTVDGIDVTAELKDTLMQAGEKYYTFTNITENHTIHAVFETDGDDDKPDGGDKPDEGDKPDGGDKPDEGGKPDGGNKPGGGDKPDEGDKPDGGDKPGESDKPDGGDKPDEGDKPDGGDKPDEGDKPGDDNKPDGGDKPAVNDKSDDDTSGNDNSSGGDNTVLKDEGSDGTLDTQTPAVLQTTVPEIGNSTADNIPVSGGSKHGVEKTAPKAGREPKTGDSTRMEVYATVAMIAGLTYLLLYFMEEGRGMTEREKEVFVAAFIRWAKKGGRFRRCCAIVAIFCLLVYYHSIGKRAGRGSFERECLRQAL